MEIWTFIESDAFNATFSLWVHLSVIFLPAFAAIALGIHK